jgi:hypothetical protein
MLAETEAIRQNPDLRARSLSNGEIDRMLVHSIPVDVVWREGNSPALAIVDFEGGPGDYPSILDRLEAQRSQVVNFDKQYAQAILDLANTRTGADPPDSLRALAEQLFTPAKVSAFLNDPARWSAPHPIGTFFRDAAATMVLQTAVEGARNPTAFVTNLMTWRMVREGTVDLPHALGYLNVMGPGGSVQAARASHDFSSSAPDIGTAADRSGTTTQRFVIEQLRTAKGMEALVAEFPDLFDEHGNPRLGQQDLVAEICRQSIGRRVAEMEMRQREILALYAATRPGVTVHADTRGVGELRDFFYGDADPERPRKAIDELWTQLMTELGW